MKSRGFTFVELLSVVAIIGLLSAVVLASFSSMRAKARDVKRQSDLAQLQLATELYIDRFGHYPDETSGYGMLRSTDPTSLWYSNVWGNTAQDDVLIDNNFLPVPLKDPLNVWDGSGGDPDFYYYYVFWDSTYSARYCPNDPTPANGGALWAVIGAETITDMNDPEQSSCELLCDSEGFNWLGAYCAVWYD
jgi:prepilin-type N-terminal cleavage/methylation domain-containing protein